MTQNAPGKAHRKGISLIELAEMFPDEEAARKWWEAIVWPEGRFCPRCGSTNTHECTHAKCPYRCTECRSYFSGKTGTVIEGSKLPYRKWVWAIYLECTSLKGVSSMKLHRDLGVTQKTAWFMLHRIRETWSRERAGNPFGGPIEADETYIGGKRKNMPKSKRKQLSGRGPAGKAAVAGMKDRETNRIATRTVEATDRETLQEFVDEHAAYGAKVYTDEAKAYNGLAYDHEAVNHSSGEYVRGMVHTNGIESFWSMLKRGHMGTYHKMSKKHLSRYASEFAGRHNVREADTIDQMTGAVEGLVGGRLRYADLIADNGLDSGART